MLEGPAATASSLASSLEPSSALQSIALPANPFLSCQAGVTSAPRDFSDYWLWRRVVEDD